MLSAIQSLTQAMVANNEKWQLSDTRNYRERLVWHSCQSIRFPTKQICRHQKIDQFFAERGSQSVTPARDKDHEGAAEAAR